MIHLHGKLRLVILSLLGVLVMCGCCLKAIVCLLPDETWEKYRDAAQNATLIQPYGLAEENYLKLIETFKKDGSNNATIGRGYWYLMKVYWEQGRYHEA